MWRLPWICPGRINRYSGLRFGASEQSGRFARLERPSSQLKRRARVYVERVKGGIPDDEVVVVKGLQPSVTLFTRFLAYF